MTLAEMLDWFDAPDEQGIPYWYGLGIEEYELKGVALVGHGEGAVGSSNVPYQALDHQITIVASNILHGLGSAYMELMIPALRELGLWPTANGQETVSSQKREAVRRSECGCKWHRQPRDASRFRGNLFTVALPAWPGSVCRKPRLAT